MLITDLDRLVSALSPEKAERFGRIFHFDVTRGYINPPPSMHAWIERQFGSLDAVREQKIVKVTNRVTYEGALFNKLRASRPIQVREKLGIEAGIIDVIRDDPFVNPLRDTPEDVFGRVQGKYCVTASNIAKYDGHHGIIIFRDANPLYFSRQHIVDYIDTAVSWAENIHRSDPDARYFFFMWNCLPKAGASLVHGHAQVSLSRVQHYARLEGLRFASERYCRTHNSNYFEDLYQVHNDLGLALQKDGVKVMAYLTPLKEKDVMLLSDKLDRSLKERTYEALACLRDKMQVTSFNLCLVPPPMWNTHENWQDFPVMVRIVDRGDPNSASCDIGTMELFGQSVVSSDPIEVARLLREDLS